MSPRTTGRAELGGVGRRMADAEHVTPGKLAERAGAASTSCASDVRWTRHRRIAASSVETLAGSDAAVAGDDGLNEEAATPRPVLAPEPGRRVGRARVKHLRRSWAPRFRFVYPSDLLIALG
jgi:hypothetical protein